MPDEVTETALTPAARPPINVRRVTFEKVIKSLREKNEWVQYEHDNVIAKMGYAEGNIGRFGRNLSLSRDFRMRQKLALGSSPEKFSLSAGGGHLVVLGSVPN
jgi:hypothetical protein